MNADDSMKYVAASVSGNISPDEAAAFESWRNESPMHQEMYEEAQKIWTHSTIQLALDDGEASFEWQKLESRINRKEESGSIKLFFIDHGYKIAAGLVIILVAYWFLNPGAHTGTTIADETVIESGGNESVFYLPDSSTVLLRANSSLTYQKAYGEKIREVHLQGEGHFVVRQDTVHPFYVINEPAVVRVVGTSFDVRNREEDSVVTVTVQEGIVKLYSQRSPHDAVTIKKNEKAFLKKQEGSRPTKDAKKRPQVKSRPSGNSNYDNETKDPQAYLSPKFTWKKNQFNQSVIDGSLSNTATLVAYKNIELKIIYTKQNGKEVVTYITLYETIHPGSTVEVHTKLMDVFANIKTLKVMVNKAETD